MNNPRTKTKASEITAKNGVEPKDFVIVELDDMK